MTAAHASLLGVVIGLLLAFAWSRRVTLLPWLARAPGWAWLVVAAAIVYAWFRRPAAAPPSSAAVVPAPTPTIIPRPEDHAQDTPIETTPDADAPLHAPDLGDADLVRWLEQRARGRADTAE